MIAQYPYLESTSYLSPLKLESNQVFEDVSTGCKATSIADGGSGEGSRLYAYQPINTEMFLSDHMGWKILLSTDATHAMKEINSARKKTFLLIGTVVILCIVLLVINILSKYKLEVFQSSARELSGRTDQSPQNEDRRYQLDADSYQARHLYDCE